MSNDISPHPVDETGDPFLVLLEFVLDELDERLHADEAFRRETACCFNSFPPEYYVDKLPMLLFAVFYRSLGWSVIPVAPRTKQAMIKWMPYQTRLPSYEEIHHWYVHYCRCHAGIAVILGPISNLFVVDVDGTEAHHVLCDKAVIDSSVLRVRSGSRAPDKYHLFFRHPELPTNAKFTPWHPSLEFRGNRGIVVLPPSLHQSRNRYAWESPLDFLLSPLNGVPSSILAALAARELKPTRTGQKRTSNVIRQSGDLMERIAYVTPEQRRYILGKQPLLSHKTKMFLLGLFANQAGWNTRIFHAACDLCGCGIELELAKAVLLSGARPRTKDDEENVVRTIESAYSTTRTPAKSFYQ